MHPFTFARHTPRNTTPDVSETSTTPFAKTPDRLPWQTDDDAPENLGLYQTYSPNAWYPAQPDQEDDPRLLAMEANEPKRRLIRDAKALSKLRRITQGQMAEEIGVPRRTLEEWLQFRRMPKAPGVTLIRRWVEAHSPCQQDLVG